jgi:hypothetical protein
LCIKLNDMSISEMKVLAFEKLSALNEESAIKEILEHLETLNTNKKSKVYNLSSHLESINERYSETLQKLAE